MKLNEANLGNLPKEVLLPKYDRSEVTSGIVHIGPSHFARGHIFKYIDDVLEHDPNWGIVAISLKSPEARNALIEQDYIYSLVEESAEGASRRVIGSLQDIIVAQENPRKALEALANPNIKLVTITVTQDGYGHDPATNQLDFNRADIKACLSAMDEPSTAVGYLVAAIDARRKAGAPPLTIMSCDNIPGNGIVLRNVVLAYAAEKSPELRRYIEDNIKFPSTMVDRIVPKTTESNILRSQFKGIFDAWPIVTEKFCQWVIEDDFSGEMPDLRAAGANITHDVTNFELMKIRMLNGAHMALGCVGRLAGYSYVHEAMESPHVSKFVDGFMSEASHTLKPIEGVDYNAYKYELLQRLKNPNMPDELVRLARNGTQKLNGRILDPLKSAMTLGTESKHLAFATAAWIQYLKGKDLNGNGFDIIDENAVNSGLQNTAKNSNGSPEPVIAASKLFNVALQGDRNFIASLRTHLHDMQNHGMDYAIENVIAHAEQGRVIQFGSLSLNKS